MTETDVQATRRRAALRGDEAVARWRIRAGAWSARVWAVVAAAPALAAVLWPSGHTVVTIVLALAVAALFLGLSFPIARGSFRASLAILALFALDKGLAVASYGVAGITTGLLVSVVIVFGLVQGFWGASSLRRIQRERDASRQVNSSVRR